VQNLRRTSARKSAACVLVNARLCVAAINNVASSTGGPAKDGCRGARDPCGHAAGHCIGDDFPNLIGGELQGAGNGALGHAFVGQIDDGPVPVDRLAGGVHGGI